MLKRVLAALCAAAMCAALVGCNQTQSQTTEPSTEQPAGETKTVTLYLPDEQGESVVPTETEITIADKEETALMDALVEAGVLPEGVAVNSLANEERNLTLDVNAAFAEALSSSGTAGETMMIASVADTYLAYYGAASLLITVDGATLETGHALYDEPFTQIFDAAPAA